MASRSETIERMRAHIRWICERIGPRPPCSDAERRCAEYIKDEWEQTGAHPVLEDFRCRPDAYPATFRWPIALFIISLCLYGLVPPATLLCSSLSCLILVFNLMLNRELIDRFFPEKQSSNVFARFDPQGPPEQTVLISCHHDANYAFPIVNRFGAKFGLFMTMVVFSNALLLLLVLLRVLFSIMGSNALLDGYERIEFPLLLLLSCTLPFQLYTFLRVISDEPVPGANDNLTGVANCLVLADHLSRPENRLKRTAVWLVSFGCEECGIRGSKRFIKRHLEEVRNAYVLNLDMVGGRETSLQVVTKEEKTLIRLSEEMVGLVQSAAHMAHIPLKAGPIMAFTDAMAFAMHGIRATSLVALGDKGVVDTYHSVEDRPEHLDYDLLYESYRLCLAFLDHMDAPAPGPSE
jgi:hypothetical protein